MPSPVTVSIDVPQAREDVFAFLDVMANHEPFTDHMLVDWSVSGPDRGVGAKAHVYSKAGGRKEPVDIEVIDADPPARIVERNVSAKGKRVGRGTYELADLPDGGTHIAFTYFGTRRRSPTGCSPRSSAPSCAAATPARWSGSPLNSPPPRRSSSVG